MSSRKPLLVYTQDDVDLAADAVRRTRERLGIHSTPAAEARAALDALAGAGRIAPPHQTEQESLPATWRMPAPMRLVDVAKTAREMYGEKADVLFPAGLPEHDYRFEMATPTGGAVTFGHNATAGHIAAYLERDGVALDDGAEDLTTAGQPHPTAAARARVAAEQLPTVGQWGSTNPTADPTPAKEQS
jgi:hypothetical protein